MPTIKFSITRDDADIELEIDYEVGPFDRGNMFGPPEFCEPPSGGDIEDIAIFGPDGAEFTPTAAELERVEQHIYATHDYSEDAYVD
jgi:hypothetical protein